MRERDVPRELQWWYCVSHRRVERGSGCAGQYRLGPYRSREEAEEALETARRRSERWDEADREWEE